MRHRTAHNLDQSNGLDRDAIANIAIEPTPLFDFTGTEVLELLELARIGEQKASKLYDPAGAIAENYM